MNNLTFFKLFLLAIPTLVASLLTASDKANNPSSSRPKLQRSPSASSSSSPVTPLKISNELTKFSNEWKSQTTRRRKDTHSGQLEELQQMSQSLEKITSIKKQTFSLKESGEKSLEGITDISEQLEKEIIALCATKKAIIEKSNSTPRSNNINKSEEQNV